MMSRNEKAMHRWTRWLIGRLMRLYRKSPFHPKLGPLLARLLARLTRQGQIAVREVDGIRYELDLGQVIDASLYYSDSFEPYAEQFFLTHLQPGMVVVDIGANVGYHTLRMARSVGPTGRVVAVEPTAWAFKKLLTNISLNPFGNIVPLQVGLTNELLGWAECHIQSSYRLDGICNIEAERVWMTTLDKLLEEHQVSHVDLIKIDVDGLEGRILQGARETLRRDCPVLFFEFYPEGMRNYGDLPEPLFALLASLGFQIQTETGDLVPDSDYQRFNRLTHSVNLVAKVAPPAHEPRK